MSDGKITFKTKIDNSDVEKDLNHVKRKIQKAEEDIAKAENAKLPLTKQSQELGVALDAAKEKLERLKSESESIRADMQLGIEPGRFMEAASRKDDVDASLKQQQKEVNSLQKRWDSINDKLDGYDLKIQTANADLARNQEKAGELSAKLSKTDKPLSTLTESLEKAQKTAQNFSKRLLSIAKSAFVFSVLYAAMHRAVNYMGQVLKTNDQFRMQLAQLKGALVTAFQPIMSVITPALSTMLQVITRIVTVVAQLIALLTGKSFSSIKENAKALDDQATAIEGVGSAAEEASKPLAAFDELNVLDSPGSGGSAGGGGGASDEIAPDFSFPELPEDQLRKILALVEAIGIGFLAWKLSGFLSDMFLANMATDTLAGKLKKLGSRITLAVGVALVITGIALEAKGVIKSIKEGLNKVNFAEILGGGGLIVSGGALIGKALGSAIMGAAIGGIVAGVPAFFTGLYDAIVNQLNILNASLIGVGATLSGAGIGAIIGMLGGPIGAGIGALIGLIVGLVTDLIIWIVQNWTELWEDIKAVCASVSNWFNKNVIIPITDFFSGMWKKISSFASECWKSIKEFFQPAVDWFSSLFESIRQTIEDVFYNIGVIADGCWQIVKKAWSIASDWFNTYVMTPISNFFTGMWNKISSLASQAWNGIKSVYSSVSNWFYGNIISPVTSYFSNLWNGFKNGAVDAWIGIKSVFGTFASWFRGIFEDAWRGIVNVFSIGGDIFVDIKDGIVSAFKRVVNSLISGINSVISVPFNGINYALRKIKNIEILGLSPFSAIREISIPSIPYLAKGAVLPANKPFLSVVGDQKNGTNVEAPLATIQEALLNAMMEYGGAGTPDININFTGDLAQLARVLKPVIDTENKRIGVSLARG